MKKVHWVKRIDASKTIGLCINPLADGTYQKCLSFCNYFNYVSVCKQLQDAFNDGKCQGVLYEEVPARSKGSKKVTLEVR